MSYERVISSLKNLFGHSPKQKTPVDAGVRESHKGDTTMSFRLVGDEEQINKSVTDFSKRLRWKMKTKERETLTITPEMAEEMLAYNDRNVPVKGSKLSHFTRQFVEGKWTYTCEPIAFSDAGRLINGQHRLMACRDSRVPFKADVSYGVPDDSFFYMDQFGRPGSDSFAVAAVPNAQMAYSATRFLVSYEHGSTGGDAALGNLTMSPKEVHEAYLRFAGIQESVKVGLRFKRDRLPSPAIAAGIHYLCSQRSRTAADEYFDKVISGVGFSSVRDPAKKVRDFLVRTDDRIRRADCAAALIQGWNAIRLRKPLTRIDRSKVGRLV